MNWVDYSIIALLIFFTFQGWKSSFTLEILDFLSFLAAFILSLRFYNQAARLIKSHFQLAHSLSSVIGFFLVWSLVELALSFLVGFLIKKLTFLRQFDEKLKFLSIIPTFLRGLISVAIILVLIATFPIQPKIKQAVNESRLGSIILTKAYSLEAPLKNIFGGITQDNLTFLTIEPKTNESINLGFKTSEFRARPDLEEQMVNLVNKERSSRGVKILQFDQRLVPVARDHSGDMFSRGYFSHFSPEGKTVADRATEKGVDFLVIGENLAYAPSLELAHQGLMNSPGHRANILSGDYNKTGIGIMDGEVYSLMITQVFSN